MKSALCFFLMMLLALCPALAEAAEDPDVVRVGDVTFTKSQLESAVDTDVTIHTQRLQLYELHAGVSQCVLLAMADR